MNFFIDTEVNLFGGSTSHEGRVEVYSNGLGIVCVVLHILELMRPLQFADN